MRVCINKLLDDDDDDDDIITITLINNKMRTRNFRK